MVSKPFSLLEPGQPWPMDLTCRLPRAELMWRKPREGIRVWIVYPGLLPTDLLFFP